MVALDDEDPRVVMATLSRANASTFSFGTFSWWLSFFTSASGPVFYMAALSNVTLMRQSRCAEILALGKNHPDLTDAWIQQFVPSHLPSMWVGVDGSIGAPVDSSTCAEMASHGVVPGKSWGSLPDELHGTWTALGCDQYVLNSGGETATLPPVSLKTQGKTPEPQ